MAATQANIILSAGEWTNLVVSNSALADADVVIQRVGGDAPVIIAFGGEQPVDRRGIVLEMYQTAVGSASAVWARSDAVAELAITMVDG